MPAVRSLVPLIAAVGLLATGAAQQASAEWPEKPITLIQGYAAGGGLDQTLMPLKPLMAERLGTSLLYAYKPGAGGQIGWELLYADGEDGYTIAGLVLPNIIQTTIFSEPQYTLDDFYPVGIIARDVPVWFVGKDSPYDDMNELIAAARERPGEITLALSAFTGEYYITVAIVEEQADVKFRTVAVGGGSRVQTDILGGHFDVGVSRPSSLQNIADEVKVLGVVGAERSPLFPDAKTFDEQLQPEIRVPHVQQAQGLMVHRAFKEENPEGFAKLVAALRESAQTDAYRAYLKSSGRELQYMTPEESLALTQEMAETMQKYKGLVEAAQNSKQGGSGG